MSDGFADVLEYFRFEGDFLDGAPYPFGHINDTYCVRFGTVGGGVCRYILQRINHHVFRDPERLMQNVEMVTAHLCKKVIAAGGDPQRETLNLVPTTDGRAFYKTEDGNYWRAYVFIDGAQTYETAQTPEHFYSAAKAFARFQQLLSDFPAGQLYETIPDFHHTPKRFAALVEALERDARGRARSVKTEIEFVEKRAADTSVLVDLLAQGQLPERVTHNDTKFNNVMIDDKTGEGVCVVDLDTVMPGLSLYDFGDAVRSAANSAAEDERDISRVWFDLDVFDRLACGYLGVARDFLTSTEVDYMPFAAWLMTFECGMRFLTDHLNGDVYFKIHRENHNLDRCRTQFKMVADMEKQMGQMEAIIRKYR